MNYKEFTGQIQHRLEMSDLGAAVKAARATLTTLGERLPRGEATDLASPLPEEIDRFLTEAEHGQRFDYQEFISRVAEREDVDEPTANKHAQEIIVLLSEIVPEGNIEKLKNDLPEDYETLFEILEERGPPQEAGP